MTAKVEIGKRIKETRKAHKMSQQKLADLLGINRVTISKYELGEIEPPLSKLMAIANHLECSVYYLMGADVSLVYESDRAEVNAAVTSTIIANALAELEADLGLAADTLAYPLFDGRYDYDTHLQLQRLWNMLNDDGKNEAWNRLEQLTRLEEYRKEDRTLGND